MGIARKPRKPPEPEPPVASEESTREQPPEVSVADGSAPTSYTVAVTEPALGLTVSTITVYVPVSDSTVVSMNVGVPVTGP